MKRSLFHEGFYKDTLRKIKSGSIFILVFSSIVSVINGFVTLSSYLSSIEMGRAVEVSIMSLFDIVTLSGFISTVFVPILTFVAFSYLYKRNESDFFETIPVKRDAMAVSGSLAVMTVFLMTLAVSVALYLLVTIPAMGKAYVIDFATFFLELLALILAAVFGIGVSLVAISVTGVPIFGAIVTVILMVVPRTVTTAFLTALESQNSALVAGHIIPFFNSNMNIHYSILFGGFLAQQTPWNYVYTAVACVVLMILGITLFKKRGSETITHKYGKHLWRHVSSILIAMVPLTYAVAFLFDFEEMGHVGLILTLISVIAFAIHDKGSAGRGVKNRGGILAFLALAVVTGVYSFSLGVTSNAFASYLPEADDIEYVSVVTTRETYVLDDLFGANYYLEYAEFVEMRAENIKLTDRETAKIISDALKEGEDETYQKFQVTVKIKSSGRVHYRKVYLSAEDYYRVESILGSNKEYNEIWQNVSEGTKYPSTYYEGKLINHDMLDGILETIEKDIARYGVERYRAGAVYDSVCKIECSVYYKGKEYNVSVPVFDYMKETLEKLENARKTIAERELEEFYSILDQIESGELSAYISVNGYVDDDYYYVDVDTLDPDFDKKKFTSELASLVSTDAREEYGNWISISISDNDLWGDNYYYSFAIDSSVTKEELKEFFRKYEGSVEN